MTCEGMPRAGAGKGSCHTVVFTPATPTSYGGVDWQYPVNNWGTSPGYVIPAGATNVSFYAKGAAGGEAVNFGAGFIQPGGTAICTDPFATGTSPQMMNAVLTTTWTQYQMPITGSYAPDVITAFGFGLAAPPSAADAGAATDAAVATDAAAGDGGSSLPSVKFYIDDIEWK
jgi:hypothetical protein